MNPFAVILDTVTYPAVVPVTVAVTTGVAVEKILDEKVIAKVPPVLEVPVPLNYCLVLIAFGLRIVKFLDSTL